MPQIPRWKVVLRIGLAALICLVILAVTIPDLGRVNFSNMASQGGKAGGITYGWQDGMCLFIIVAPLVLIVVGIMRSKIAERVGWVWLLIVLVLRFIP
jgi:hypothetical protein